MQDNTSSDILRFGSDVLRTLLEIASLSTDPATGRRGPGLRRRRSPDQSGARIPITDGTPSDARHETPERRRRAAARAPLRIAAASVPPGGDHDDRPPRPWFMIRNRPDAKRPSGSVRNRVKRLLTGAKEIWNGRFKAWMKRLSADEERELRQFPHLIIEVPGVPPNETAAT